MDIQPERGCLTPAEYDALLPRLAGSPREAANGIEWPIICPFHVDTKRSAEVNVTTGVWWCHACQDGGAIQKLMQRRRDWRPVPEGFQPRRSARRPQASRLDEDLVQRCHLRLRDHESFQDARDYLRGRQISDSVRDRYQLGHYQGKITFPIRDENGKLVNMRLHNYDGGSPKMLSFSAGTGASQLYPFDQLDEAENTDRPILFDEGEIDTLSTISRGLNAITCTNGTSGWNNRFAERFRDVPGVIIIPDCDSEGLNYAKKVAQQLSLRTEPNTVRIVELPFPPGSKKDLNDWWMEHAAAGIDGLAPLLDLISAVTAVPAPVPATVPVRPSETRRNVSVLRTAPDIIPVPCAVLRRCVKQPGDEPCELCPEVTGEHRVPLLPPSHEYIPGFVGLNPAKTLDALRLVAGVPDRSSGCLDEYPEMFDVYELEVAKGSKTFVAHYVTTGEPPDGNAHLVGRKSTLIIRGRTRSTFHCWDYTVPLDEVAEHKPDPKALEQFQVPKGSDPLRHTRRLARQFSQETQVWGQPTLTALALLTMHSPPMIAPFGDEIIGMLDVAVMGATQSGKTQTFRRLERFYDRGALVPGESATIPGLIGSAMGEAPTRGVLPQNNRGLVVLDESDTLIEREVFHHLNSVRSSGRAKIDKARHADWEAIVRLVCIINQPPGFEEQYESLAYNAIRDLFKSHELSRFDLACGVERVAVDDREEAKVVAEKQTRIVRERAVELLDWVWSRNASQVIFGDETRDALRTASKALQEHYREAESELLINMDLKLARLAAAFAGLTFSTLDSVKLIVKVEHVEAARRFVRQCYDESSFDMILSVRRRRQNDEDARAALRELFISNAAEMQSFVYMARLSGQETSTSFYQVFSDMRGLAKQIKGIGGLAYDKRGKLHVTRPFRQALDDALKETGVSADTKGSVEYPERGGGRAKKYKPRRPKRRKKEDDE